MNALRTMDVVEHMEQWIAEREGCRFIAVTSMHGISEAQKEASVRDALTSADLVVPDGMPLVWLARRRGLPLQRRVYGPELMATFLKETGDRYAHFFYGSTPDLVDRLASVVSDQYGTRVVGKHSPPFRLLTSEEETQIAEAITACRPDVVWVGLSTPKQELWMHRFRSLLPVPVLVGVGAAFDFLAGEKPSAPVWMQDHGLEWLYRLCKEPRRLWRRYLIGGSRFIKDVMIEEAKRKRTH